MLQQVTNPDTTWVKLYECRCGNRWLFDEKAVFVKSPEDGGFGDDPSRFWVLCPICHAKTCVGTLLRYLWRHEMAAKARREVLQDE